MLKRAVALFAVGRGGTFVPDSIADSQFPDFADPAAQGLSRPDFGGLRDLSSNEGIMNAVPAPAPELKPQPQLKKVNRPMSLGARLHFADLSEDKVYHRVDAQWFGLRLDEFLLEQYGDQWSFETILSLVQQGHIYRYRNDGKKLFTKITDRLELNELVVVPTRAHWEKQLAPPAGVLSDSEADAKPANKEVILSSSLRQEAMSWVLF